MIPASPSGKKFDLAHLVALLVSLREPSRDADRIVNFMLAGSSVLPIIASMEVRLSNWMSADAIPAYTAGGRAVFVLAHRLGMKMDCKRTDFGHFVSAFDPDLGLSRSVSGILPGAAACAAMAAVAAEREALPTRRPRR